PISGLSLEEKPITLYSGSVKPLRVLHHRWRVQRVLRTPPRGRPRWRRASARSWMPSARTHDGP
ncbi:MAG: hypothetical protein ACYTKD_04400, partial [Planctomycetota bacterium]